MDEILRLSDPGEMAAAVPALVGFQPHESVVLIATHGDRGRLGLTVRADLPSAADAVPLAQGLAARIATDAPAGVLVAVFSEAPDEEGFPGAGPGATGTDLPHRDLVRSLVLGLAARRLGVPGATLVRRSRWWSYDCPFPCCAPGAGTPLPTGVSPVAVAAIAAGSVVEPDRAALSARIARPDGLPDPPREQGGLLPVLPPEEAIGRALGYCRPGSTSRVPDREVAAVVRALTDLAVRDRALGLALGRDAPAAETLWTECTRRTPAPLDAAPATLLAVSAWLRGDGAMANVALERALGSRPGYRLAELLGDALSAGLPPAALRSLIGDVVGRAGDERAAG